MQGGTIVDATIISATNSTKNKEEKMRDRNVPDKETRTATALIWCLLVEIS